jgi:hypothetical protein
MGRISIQYLEALTWHRSSRQGDAFEGITLSAFSVFSYLMKAWNSTVTDSPGLISPAVWVVPATGKPLV